MGHWFARGLAFGKTLWPAARGCPSKGWVIGSLVVLPSARRSGLRPEVARVTGRSLGRSWSCLRQDALACGQKYWPFGPRDGPSGHVLALRAKVLALRAKWMALRAMYWPFGPRYWPFGPRFKAPWYRRGGKSSGFSVYTLFMVRTVCYISGFTVYTQYWVQWTGWK